MRMVPLKALLITQYYRPELIGSAPFCADLAEWLNAQGRRVAALTGLPHYPHSEVFPEYRKPGRAHEVINGVAVERIRNWIPRRRSAPARIFSEILFVLQGATALIFRRIGRHPLVFSLCPSVLCVALGTLAKQRGGRHVAIVHDIQSGLAQGLKMVDHGFMIRMMRWCERSVLNRVDLIVVLTEEMKRQLRSIGVDRPIEVVPIWVDTDRIAPIENEAARVPNVLYSGNFGKKQGLGQIIAMAEELQERRPEIAITLRGNGSQAQEIAAVIEARRLKNTRLCELLPDSDLAKGLASGDIHLVPQNPEAAAFAIPSKIFNIMAAGRPFVTSALPGSPLWSLQQESKAFLCVPPNNPSAFADAVLRLADDPKLCSELGARGREFVERHCSKRKVLGDLLVLVDGLYANA